MAEELGLTTIAERYAQALLELAEQKECIDFVKNDLITISQIIKQSPELNNYLSHPLIPLKDKKETIQQLLTDRANPYVINLIKLLLDRNRMFAFGAIAESFIKLFNKKFNIVVASVITAVEIDENLINNIKQKLSILLSKQIELNAEINPDILGGVVVKIDDKIIDGSIKGRLESIGRQLA